ncbi:MAG: serine/threonine-protein kinase [Archangium sp.]
MSSLTAPGEMTVLGGRYRLLQRLGQGGHAEVFLAEQLSLERKVALKVITRRGPREPEADARFKREALIHSSIEHPSVVRILDFETDGPEGTVVVLEYVDGRRLDEVITSRGVIPPVDAWKLLVQLAEGLAAIHAKGVVHRDFKAENVMITAGSDGQQARILDFGLARLFDADLLVGDGRSFVSSSGMVAGTPAYLAPEQLRGLPADPRSDVYAFGVVAHFMLRGTLPFGGPEISDYVKQHTEQQPPPLPSDIPQGLRDFVERCMSKEAAKRPADGGALARELTDLTPLLKTLTTQALAKKKAARGPRRWPLVLFSLLVMAAPFVAIERLWEPGGQAKWLLIAGKPELALERLGNGSDHPELRALALHALGRADELKALLDAQCVPIAAALEPADRAKLGISLTTCH